MKQLRKFSLKKFFIAILPLAILCTLTFTTEAQRIQNKVLTRPLAPKDTILPKKDSTDRIKIISSDTSRFAQDSLGLSDSLPGVKTDTFALKLSKDTLD